MSRRPSVSAVRAVSRPAECDQFRFASCKAPRPSSVPPPLLFRARERERGTFLTRENSLLALRSFHPFPLSPPFSLSLERPPSRTPPFLTQLSPFLPFSLFLSFSLPRIPSPQCYRSRVSLLGLTHFPPLPRRRRFFSVVLVFRAVVLFLFFPLVPLFSRGWVPFPPEFAPESCISLPYRHRHLHRAVPASPFLRRPFLSLSIAVCSALFEFKRGSRRCLVSPS